MEENIHAKFLHENYKTIKKNGKFYLLVLLATIPGLCYSSVTLHTIKIGIPKTIRCEIESLENTSWRYQEIQEISQIVGVHKECFIYDYDYDKLGHMTFKDAKKLVDEEYVNKTYIMCTKFVTSENNSLSLTYAKDLTSYCEDLSYDLFYDFGAIVPYSLSCLFLAPLADIFGRKEVLSLGCHLVYIAVFLKIILLDFTREAIGEAVMNCAYPVLKYTTDAIIFELSGNELRPAAFVLTFVGLLIPTLIAGLFPPIYWKYSLLLSYSAILLLPPLLWYLPESPMWFISKKRFVEAQLATETLNNSGKHNDMLLLLRNKKITSKVVREQLRELKKINLMEFLSINAIAVCVGFLSFYTYSKHKFMYNYFETNWIKLLNLMNGLLAICLSIPCVYCMNGVKFLLAVLFFINGVLFSALSIFNSESSSEFAIIMILVSTIEITTSTTKILYEFYLQNIFPTSHRCTCTAICGASMNFGLLILIGIRTFNVFGSIVSTSMFCILCCISVMFVIKNLPRVNSLLVNFGDDNNEKERLKICCNIL